MLTNVALSSHTPLFFCFTLAGFYLTPSDLRSFMSANNYATSSLAEAPRSGMQADTDGGSNSSTLQHVKEYPIDFLLYCPDTSTAPLVFKASHSTHRSTLAFQVPGYGGVAVLNPVRSPVSTKQHKTAVIEDVSLERFAMPMAAFTSHIRAILGLQSSSSKSNSKQQCSHSDRSSSDQCHDDSMQVTLLTANQHGVTLWELDALTRIWSLKRRALAIETLKALATLTSKVKQMEIHDEVAIKVQTAVDAILQLDSLLTSTTAASSNTKAATAVEIVKLARDALTYAEAAYFDSSIIAQMYFPQEHLYAVYAPLIAPLLLPLLLGLCKEYQRYKAKRKAKQQAVEKSSSSTSTAAHLQLVS
jgi:GPI-anchor transamidase subunit S